MAVLPPPYTTRKPSPPSRSRTLNILPTRSRNRSLSLKAKKDHHTSGSGGAYSAPGAPKHRFTMATLRGMQQPELSKKLFKLIKSENHAIQAHEAAGRERISIATQLSDWGEATGDDAVSELSDKLGVIMAEVGEQENAFAEGLEEYRGILKQIRNTEGSVQPSRDHKLKVADEIQRLKYKDPQSAKIAQLEQELVRAEAENLVAEAQLTNITRQKLKEAYDAHFAAIIERSEKQVILARHARRLLTLLDDTPVVPGDTRPAFEHANQARQVLLDAEEDLRDWQPDYEPITTSAGVTDASLLPTAITVGQSPASSQQQQQQQQRMISGGTQQENIAASEVHPAYRKGGAGEGAEQTESRRFVSGGSTTGGAGGGGNTRNDSLYATSDVGAGAGEQQQYAAI
ncbi:MAG: hypothetical protein M1816_007193 [Peltula sp. TS41687]|nr:MAG: hypothetical protein M1816_007193 [Peltula sp. TS41687]